MSEIHQGDIGTVFKVRIINDITGDAVDVSSATEKTITFRKPDKTAVEKTATFSTDGSDGYIQYSTIAGDLDQIGLWKLQARVVSPTFTNNSETDSFEVKKNL